MISKEEIENLAELSRLKLTEGEIKNLQKDFEAILEYVGQINQLSLDSEQWTGGPRNVMREDIEGMVGGSRSALLAAAPKLEHDYIVVRKIISKDE